MHGTFCFFGDLFIYIFRHKLTDAQNKISFHGCYSNGHYISIFAK